MEEQNMRKRVRDDSDELGIDLTEVKRIKEDLFGLLDDSDPDSLGQDLDSVMRSFEQEISASISSSVAVVDLASESGESQPELGYLLEASDDELGLPPSSANSSGEETKSASEETELARVDSAESSGVGGEFWGFDEQIPSYDSFGLGAGGSNADFDGEYVPFDDGLFEYSNVCFDSSEYPDLSWRLGAMPAE